MKRVIVLFITFFVTLAQKFVIYDENGAVVTEIQNGEKYELYPDETKYPDGFDRYQFSH